MNQNELRIQYLTYKAQRGVITLNERHELANLLGRNPNEFKTDDDLKTLVGIGLVAIAIALLAEIISKK